MLACGTWLPITEHPHVPNTRSYDRLRTDPLGPSHTRGSGPECVPVELGPEGVPELQERSAYPWIRAGRRTRASGTESCPTG